MKKSDWLLVYIIIFIGLIMFRMIGPTQPYFNWTLTTTRLANAILIIAFSFILLQISSIALKNTGLVRGAHYVILVGTAIVLIFAYYERVLELSISLGILAVAATFIFQTPLLSLFAWIYLTAGKVYSIGDRIRIGSIKGDVIDINPLRTKVLEVGGEYISADLPSGKLVTFPNSLLLSEPLYNYTKSFPYVWVDISFHLTYETDFDFVKSKIEQIIQKYLKEKIKNIQETYEKTLQLYGVKKRKFVGINFNLIAFQGWIELRVTFPVDPKEQSKATTEVTEEILKMFNKHPNKVRFPKGRAR